MRPAPTPAEIAALIVASSPAYASAAVSAGIGAGLIGVFVVWCARAVTRPTIVPERPPGDSR